MNVFHSISYLVDDFNEFFIRKYFVFNPLQQVFTIQAFYYETDDELVGYLLKEAYHRVFSVNEMRIGLAEDDLNYRDGLTTKLP